MKMPLYAASWKRCAPSGGLWSQAVPRGTLQDGVTRKGKGLIVVASRLCGATFLIKKRASLPSCLCMPKRIKPHKRCSIVVRTLQSTCMDLPSALHRGHLIFSPDLSPRIRPYPTFRQGWHPSSTPDPKPSKTRFVSWASFSGTLFKLTVRT